MSGVVQPQLVLNGEPDGERLDRLESRRKSALLVFEDHGKMWSHVQAQVRVQGADASPERVFGGQIRELGRLFRVKSAEVPKMIFDVTILLDEPDPGLMRPGMAASVEILAPTDESFIQIPESAVHVEDGQPVVRARRNSGKLETVPVRLGSRWEGRVVVLDGLSPGDRIAIEKDAS